MTTAEAFSGAEDNYTINVVIAHRNDVIKRGLEKILTDSPSVGRVRSCDGWRSAMVLLAAKSDHASLLIVSRSLIGSEADLQTLGGEASKVLLLLDAAAYSGVSAADSWVDGFLIESTLTAQSLEQALSQLKSGQMPLPTAIARSALTEAAKFRKLSATQRMQLTHREMQTLRLIVDGLSNKQIARQLHIGVNSVKRHVSMMLAKLNCPNRTKAAAYAVDAGLVEKSQHTPTHLSN